MPKEPAHPDLADAELTMAKTLVNSMVAQFKPEEYHDEYQVRLRQIIEDKIAGKEVVQAPAEKPDNVINIMEALQASLKQVEDEKTPPKKKRTTRKKAETA